MLAALSLWGRTISEAQDRADRAKREAEIAQAEQDIAEAELAWIAGKVVLLRPEQSETLSDTFDWYWMCKVAYYF